MLTTRNASKYMDDLGVDFINTDPLLIQVKSGGYHFRISEVLGKIVDNIKKGKLDGIPVLIVVYDGRKYEIDKIAIMFAYNIKVKKDVYIHYGKYAPRAKDILKKYRYIAWNGIFFMKLETLIEDYKNENLRK